MQNTLPLMCHVVAAVAAKRAKSVAYFRAQRLIQQFAYAHDMRHTDTSILYMRLYILNVACQLVFVCLI